MKIFVLFVFILLPANNIFSMYSYQFPKDHSAHLGYQLEWWYYTGHLKTKDNQRFGYELTFFKIDWTSSSNKKEWKSKALYLAHFAITDKNNKQFYYSEKINRPIGKIAGASTKNYNVWNEGWSVTEEKNIHYLKAKMKDFEINLSLKPLKKPVIHGENGKSYKGKNKDNFSYYYSLTRLETKGMIKVKDQVFQCQGLSWMDHEWMNNRKFNKGNERPKWDWFSIQLDNHSEIMFYILRDEKNKIKSVSSGTLIFPNGKKKHLFLKDVKIKKLEYWTSPISEGKYPAKWSLTIPSEQIYLELISVVDNQELITKKSTGIVYWEGAIKVSGQWRKKKVAGQGYVELTGYNQIKMNEIKKR